MTPEVEAKLKELGLAREEQVLRAACEPAARKELASKLGVETGVVLELANRIDLARVKGIGVVFSDLLENAGVDTIKELAHRVPENLHAKLVAVNEEKKLAHHVPTVEQVADWVAQAKELPKLLIY
jgi:predicted flap endonuclease-1-like 5' DNA nuclease